MTATIGGAVEVVHANWGGSFNLPPLVQRYQLRAPNANGIKYGVPGIHTYLRGAKANIARFGGNVSQHSARLNVNRIKYGVPGMPRLRSPRAPCYSCEWHVFQRGRFPPPGRTCDSSPCAATGRVTQ